MVSLFHAGGFSWCQCGGLVDRLDVEGGKLGALDQGRGLDVEGTPPVVIVSAAAGRGDSGALIGGSSMAPAWSLLGGRLLIADDDS